MNLPRRDFLGGRDRRFLRALNPVLGYRMEMLEARRLLSAPTQWTSTGIGGGGALFTPALSPFNTSEVWLATDMSELFHTTNMGASWTYPNFNQIEGDPSVNVQFTSNPKILYSINALSTYPTVASDSLSQSTDAGATWTSLPGWNSNNIPYSLYANSNSTSELVASDGTNLYFSNNSGQTFNVKYTAASAGTLFCAGAYFNGSDIFVGTNQGLLESTNNGSTFSVASVGGIPSGQAMLSFAGSTAGSTTRFFCVTVPSSDLAPGVPNYSVAYDYSGIYSLTLGHANWAVASSGISSSDYPDFISMTAGDINDVYAAGTGNPDLDYPTIYKTTDAGGSWTMDFETVGNVNINTAWEGQGGDNNWGFGGCAFGLEVSPANVNVVVMSDEDGCYDTTNGGTTWTQMFVSPADSNPAGQDTPDHKAYVSTGMNQTSVWDLTWTSQSNLFASFTDITGIHSTDGGNSWSFPNYGSVLQNTIYQTVVGPTGTLYGADSSQHDLFQSDCLTDDPIDSGTGAVIMSTDGGADWTMLHNFNMPVDNIILDPNVANRAYALVVNSTSGGIFVTNDLNEGASSTWTKLANPPRTQGHPWDMQILNDGTLVVTYSGRFSGSTFTDSSGIFTSTNGGTSWTDVSDSDMDYYTKDVIIDPQDPTQNTWYVCVNNGWGGNGNNLGGIYKTTNRGQSWTQIFSADGVDSLTVNPATHEMYVATVTNGLWYSSNANAAAPTFNELTAYPFHQPEGIFLDPYNANEIWVTSFGGGLMVGTTPGPVLSGSFGKVRSKSAQVTVSNSGTSALAKPYSVALYASTSQVLGSNGIFLGKINVSQRLNANRSVEISVPLSVPSGTPLGAYHLIALAGPRHQLTQIAATRHRYTLGSSQSVARPSARNAAVFFNSGAAISQVPSMASVDNSIWSAGGILGWAEPTAILAWE